MSNDLIRKSTRDAFREYMVKWKVLREIQDMFDAESIEYNENHQSSYSGERRVLIEQYYSTLDFTRGKDTQKALRVFENILITASEDGPDKDEIARLKNFLLRDGFKFENGQLVTSNHSLPSIGMTTNIARDFDTPEMVSQIKRIEASIESEPDLAIGSAKELLETCCKTILSDHGIDYSNKADLLTLIKTVQKELKLMPDNIPDSAKGAESIKRMLNNLGDVVRGMAEIRNLYGSGHGKHGRVNKVKPRHAKLAVGAATTLVVFLYETHLETINDKE